jgi:hypothetical protein
MPLTENKHDALLVRYLLGSLPAEEAERLEEQSIVDDAFATRLSEVENDLVDAYVRGELPTQTAEQFQAAYLSQLSSPARREKVSFARAFLSVQRRYSGAAATAGTDRTAGNKPEKRWRFFTLPRLMPQWGLAAAALALVIISGYLSISNRQLKERVDVANADKTALQQRTQQLEGELKTAASQQANQPATPAQPPDQLRFAAFMLTPSLRGAGTLPAIAVSPGTDMVVLKLTLEVSDFAGYRAALEDSATRKTLWQSSELKPASDGGKQSVSFAFRANLLKSQNYIVQLSGVRGHGLAELVTSYPFRAVAK